MTDEELRKLAEELQDKLDYYFEYQTGENPQKQEDIILAALQSVRNAALDEAERKADLRSQVFGGEPTTANEFLLVRHIVEEIRKLKTEVKS